METAMEWLGGSGLHEPRIAVNGCMSVRSGAGWLDPCTP